MALRRRLRRPTARVRPSRASGFRRVARGRRSRFTRSRRIRRRPMTNRRILNVSSKKKVDTMMPLVIGNDGVGTEGPLLVTPAEPGQGFNSLYIPSARDYYNTNSSHARSAETIFVRGYKERVNVTVSGGATWTWRRTVFCMKGDMLRDAWTDNSQPPQYDSLGPMAGQTPTRSIGPMDTILADVIRGLLYRGVQGSDWYDPYTAPIDTTRVTLLRDQVITINPTNDSGRTRMYRFWQPINKNLAYQSYENDESTVSGAYSVRSKPGIGDIYIFDQVRRETGAATASFRFSPEGTFYWHER
ncbi:capsid protein [sewage derived gemykibivirus 2]|uniref:Capsid protein n=1 Tax=sewage derived gemykibivirus 2 TaxID=2004968 RepID=A0A0A7CL77_9VIRU|nr:capsid protein [Sewage-associated gemycircularvirus 2]AIF34848.1 capsid protein [Sewage-associated gemycircularvirus 2]